MFFVPIIIFNAFIPNIIQLQGKKPNDCNIDSENKEDK